MIYLKFEKTLDGNSTEKGFEKQLIVDSYSHSLVNPLTVKIGNSDRTSDGPQFSQMSFSKVMDISTPLLYQACANNRILGTATISVTRVEGGEQMLTIKYVLGDAMIESISTSGAAGSDLPYDNFTINFSSITSEYTKQKVDSSKEGVAPFGWDLTLRQPK